MYKKFQHTIYLRLIASQLHLVENTIWLDQYPHINNTSLLGTLRACIQILQNHEKNL